MYKAKYTSGNLRDVFVFLVAAVFFFADNIMVIYGFGYEGMTCLD